MKHLVYTMMAVMAFVLASCGEQKIEPADPPITFKEYKSSYKYIHNLPLDGCFEVVSVGAVLNDREGDAELAFTINVKMVKALSHKPKDLGIDQTMAIQYLDENNNVLGTTGKFGTEENIIGLSVGQMGTVTGSAITTKKEAEKLLKKIKYVRIIDLTAAYEDEDEKKQLEEKEAEAQKEVVDESDYTSEASGENWDAVLDSYEKYVNNYLRLMKKAKAGDASALSEYASMLQEAQEFGEKLSNAQGELTPAQQARYLKITKKMGSL